MDDLTDLNQTSLFTNTNTNTDNQNKNTQTNLGYTTSQNESTTMHRSDFTENSQFQDTRIYNSPQTSAYRHQEWNVQPFKDSTNRQLLLVLLRRISRESTPSRESENEKQ